MEERRLLLALGLLVLALMAHQWLFGPAPNASPTRNADAPRSEPATTAPTTPAAAPAAAVAPSAVAISAPVVADDRERRVEIHSPDVEIAFTNRGARIVSWRLKRYADDQGRGEEMVESLPLDAKPLDIETGDRAVDGMLRTALFRPSAESVAVPADGEATLELQFSDGRVEVRKQITLGRGFTARVQVSVRKDGVEQKKLVAWGPGLENATAEDKSVQGYQPPQGVFLGSGAVERLSAEKLGERPQTINGAAWAGVETQYFAAVWVPGSAPTATVDLRAAALPADPDKPKEKKWVPTALLDLGTSTEAALLYVGPKDHTALTKLGHHLEKIVPVGDWIGAIVIAFMRLLRWVHSHVGNYGWAIVILTVLINLVMAPLRHASIANGRKMAKMAPEMKVVQERYRKLPLRERQEKMHVEMSALYARHGLNMGSQMIMGCLPLLLTMPFLFAFYKVLQVSIELRGAEFLWIADLSRKDPLFITPVLMGASMFVMQNLTPTSLEPAQKRMMMLMPLVFVTMLFAAPAGLNLYWLASNLCSIVQQAATLRILDVSEGTKERKKK